MDMENLQHDYDQTIEKMDNRQTNTKNLQQIKSLKIQIKKQQQANEELTEQLSQFQTQAKREAQADSLMNSSEESSPSHRVVAQDNAKSTFA